MTSKTKDRERSGLSGKAWRLIEQYLRKRLNRALSSRDERIALRLLGDPVFSLLREILTSTELSYRDAVLVQLAFGVCSEHGLDLALRHEGARGVGGRLGKLLPVLHIKGVQDAFQNIGKNTAVLARGNYSAFDDFLRWASSSKTSKRQLCAAFIYAASMIAGTARSVKTLPELNYGRLTFARVCGVIASLLETGSRGAYEQFIIAALLQALVEESGLPYRVETKHINATDRSTTGKAASASGDVQILDRLRVVDSYEITANEWPEKLDMALRAMRERDLGRIHILTSAPGNMRELFANLNALPGDSDIAVLPVLGFSFCIVSTLRRQHRGHALRRLYELLDRNQPDPELVNRFVELLIESGLTV